MGNRVRGMTMYKVWLKWQKEAIARGYFMDSVDRVRIAWKGRKKVGEWDWERATGWLVEEEK